MINPIFFSHQAGSSPAFLPPRPASDHRRFRGARRGSADALGDACNAAAGGWLGSCDDHPNPWDSIAMEAMAHRNR